MSSRLARKLKREKKINWQRVAVVSVPIVAGIILALYVYPLLFGVPKPAFSPETVLRDAWIEVDTKSDVAYLVVIVYNPAPTPMNITRIRVEGKELEGGPTPDYPYTLPPGTEKKLMYVLSTNKKYIDKLLNDKTVVVAIDYRVGNVFNFSETNASVIIK